MKADDAKISRRTFNTALATTLASAWLMPPRWSLATGTAIGKPIPASGEALPVIGLGTSRTFDVGTDADGLNRLVPVLRSFFEQGGGLIDSSPMYGSSEEVLGQLLNRLGPQAGLFSATKVWTDGEQAGVRQMKESLQLWGLPRFDLMQIHNLRDWQIHLKTLNAWKAEGKIRYTGITTSHGRFHRDLEQILRTERFDFVQLSYNIDNRTVEERLLPIAADRGVAVLVNRPYQRGSLFRRVKDKPLPDWATEIDCASWGQFFLKFIVSHPAVTCAIPATTKVKHIKDNMAAGFGRLPDAAMRQEMIAYFNAV